MRGPTVGLPRMHKEPGERRDFLPDMVAFLGAAGASAIVLEDGYGSAMDIAPETYLAGSPWARFGTMRDAFEQEVVVVLRYPEDESIRMLRPGAVLVSMLHLHTRPERAVLLEGLGVHGISMDAIVDDTGTRLIENLAAVGWNGVRSAFEQIELLRPDFRHPSRRPLHVTCLGAGGVAGHAARAATRYGDPDLRREMVERNVPGVEVTVVDFDLTWHEDYMRSRLDRTDLLIDATQREDPTRPVVPNPWLAGLPADGVVLDLSADPYDFTLEPPRVKGIEGIPHGNLDRWIFPPSDPAWDALDVRVDTTNRRTTLSCYSWPGLQPVECMDRYGEQLEPALGVVLSTRVDRLDPEYGSHIERAVARAETSRFSQRMEVWSS